MICCSDRRALLDTILNSYQILLILYESIEINKTISFLIKAPKMALKQITDDNFSSLLEYMDPSLDLLARVRSVPFVKDRVSFIDDEPTKVRKNYALLKVLTEVPVDFQESVMNSFLSALKFSGQEHVANIFRRESDKVPMSVEHNRTLMVEKIDELCEFIDTENGLLRTLVETEVINPVNAQDVRATAGYNEKARILIEILAMKSDDAFDGFINALNKRGHSHVTYILTGEGNSRPLKEEHRKRLLTTKRDYLVNTIDSKTCGLITALMSRGVFSNCDEQRVSSVQPHEDRNELILNLIARKSQSDFFNFISALNETGQTHVVLLLLGADVVAKIKAVYESGAHGAHMSDVDEELVEHIREMIRSNGAVMERINELLSPNGVTVSGVRKGCIEVTFACESVKSLEFLRDQNDTGKLGQMLNDAFCLEFAKKGLVSLQVVISNEQFEQCREMFTHWIPMHSEHREALQSSEEWLMGKMAVSDDLLDKLSLCGRRRHSIEQETATREQQVKMLLDIIIRRPDSAFAELISALNATNQHEAASVISKKTATETRASKLHIRTDKETSGKEIPLKAKLLTMTDETKIEQVGIRGKCLEDKMSQTTMSLLMSDSDMQPSEKITEGLELEKMKVVVAENDKPSADHEKYSIEQQLWRPQNEFLVELQDTLQCLIVVSREQQATINRQRDELSAVRLIAAETQFRLLNEEHPLTKKTRELKEILIELIKQHQQPTAYEHHYGMYFNI